MRGDFERTIQCFRKIDSDAVKLRACPLGIAAAISAGNYPFYQEVESYCKVMASAGLGANVTAVAEYALCIAYVNSFAPAMIPNWMKDGDFSSLPRQFKLEALCLRTRYLYFLKKYETMLDVAQTALTLYEPGEGISHVSITLRLICAEACRSLDRLDETKYYLLEVMRDCLPCGFITPFAENLPLFGGLLEQLLEREYPEYYKAVTEQSRRTIMNWRAFHNRFTKENITLTLSMRDLQIAALAARGAPYKKIAGQFHMSLGTLNNKMHVIYETLSISGKDRRRELAKYVL